MNDARIALACLDLTSLNDADREADIVALAARARGPCGAPAALCVWPRFVALARREAPAGVAIAAVANFPHGGTDIAAAVRDTEAIVAAGGHEVDLVLPWRALLAGDERAAAAVLAAVRRACEGLRLKVILESGELPDAASMGRAAALALAEGADFLKTSTGKTAHGATPAAARVLLETIAATPGSTAGFKASGGVRTVADAAPYIALVRELLGPGAVGPQRLRLGASALLDDIEAVLGGRTPPAPAAGY
jgi:deoxyribose-phosphate aldolase